MKVLVVFGNRPEAIKLAPVILSLRQKNIEVEVCVKGKHRDMLDQMLQTFEIVPDYDLKIMKTNPTLPYLTSTILIELDEILTAHGPFDYLIVQADTLSGFSSALVAFFHKIKVEHVEAGLRTDNLYDPLPEEASPRLIGQITNQHFTPTTLGQNNLKHDGISDSVIHVMCNTVIDALLRVREHHREFINATLQSILQKGFRTILLINPGSYRTMAQAVNPYSDRQTPIKNAAILLEVHEAS